MARPTGFSEITLLCLALLAVPVVADDLGVLGKRYPFAEQDYYEVLMAQVRKAQAEGVFMRQMEEQKQRMKDYLARPSGLSLPSATEPVVHYVDPTYQLQQAIVDAEGKVLYPEGFTFNPLHYMSWDKRFCMIDAAREAQVRWAEQTCQQAGRDRIVLVNGAYLATQKRLGRPVYFDQYGKISERFGLQFLPSLVFQEGDLIKVEAHVVQ